MAFMAFSDVLGDILNIFLLRNRPIIAFMAFSDVLGDIEPIKPTCNVRLGSLYLSEMSVRPSVRSFGVTKTQNTYKLNMKTLILLNNIVT